MGRYSYNDDDNIITPRGPVNIGHSYDLDYVHASDRRASKRLRERSISSDSRARRNRKTVSLSDDVLRHLKENAGRYIITVLLTAGIIKIPDAFRTITHVDNNVAYEMVMDEYKQIIVDATVGRSDDGFKPIYNYQKIAQHLVDSGNFDDGLYAIYHTFSLGTNIETQTRVTEEQTIEEVNNVLKYTEYNDFDNYLMRRGYKDIKDYEKDMKIRLKKESEMQVMQQELDEMAEEHPITDSNGGRSL